MSIFVLKVIALLTMMIDHTAAIFSEAVATPAFTDQAVYFMRTIGRVAFPIYAFLLAEGFRHTRDWRKYAFRLFGLGLLSQIPYAFTINGWVSFSDMPWWRRISDLNILFTLTLGVLLLAFLDTKRLEKMLDSWGAAGVFAALAVLFYCSTVYLVAFALGVAAVSIAVARFAVRYRWAAGQVARFVLFAFPLFWVLQRNFLAPSGEKIHFSFDYGLYALALFAALHWAKSSRRAAIVIVFWGYWCYFGDWFAVALVAVSAGCIALYNGKKGMNDHRLFYWAYPAHLFLLWGGLVLYRFPWK